MVSLGEFEIIARYFAPLASDPAALGLTDDAAILERPGAAPLVLTNDALVEGVHFLPSDPPDAIGHKALAVNLSDLAAKGAEPIGYLLALCLPEQGSHPARSAAWLDSLVRGLRQLQERAGAALLGGDTTATPGPLTLSITALGSLPEGKPALRSGARPGDSLYVTGTVGDAMLGLKLLREPRLAQELQLTPAEVDYLIRRYQRPQPRLALAPALRSYASAAIDISDGLGGDLQKLCKASGAGAALRAPQVPLSGAAEKVLRARPQLLPEFFGGGDDYEILAAVPQEAQANFEAAAAEAGVSLRRIGDIEAAQTAGGEARIAFLDSGGRPLDLPIGGYTHFASGEES